MANLPDSHDPVPPDALREIMRLWATGVVITTAGHEGVRHGMTVSSFTSLSLEPPLVMVSLENTTRTCSLVSASNAFGITILRHDQKEISNLFAGRETEDKDRFEGVDTFTLKTGSPFIKGGIAYLDCKLVSNHPAGTHNVYFGEVVAVRGGDVEGHIDPLMYFNRDYRKIKY